MKPNKSRIHKLVLVLHFCLLNIFCFSPGSGAEYVRKEIPLLVMPSSSLLNLDTPLSSFTDLQRVLYEEERTAFNQAVTQNMRWHI